MDIGKPRQPRHLLVETRVVLHGAGAEWKYTRVDGVIFLAQTDIMADGLRLRKAGQADGLAALKTAEAVSERVPPHPSPLPKGRGGRSCGRLPKGREDA